MEAEGAVASTSDVRGTMAEVQNLAIPGLLCRYNLNAPAAIAMAKYARDLLPDFVANHMRLYSSWQRRWGNFETSALVHRFSGVSFACICAKTSFPTMPA